MGAVKKSMKNGQRYHITGRIKYGTGDWQDLDTVVMEGISPRADADIALYLAFAGKQKPSVVESHSSTLAPIAYKDVAVEPCNEPRCARCAERGWALDAYYEVGEYIIQTYGEYSDYGIGQFYRVIQRFAPEDFGHPGEAVLAGYLEECKHREWWTG